MIRRFSLLILLGLCFATPAWAGTSLSASEVQALNQNADINASEKSTTATLLSQDKQQAYAKMADDIVNALVVSGTTEELEAAKPFPMQDDVLSLTYERSVSENLTASLNDRLNDVVTETFTGHKRSDDSASDQNTNMFLNGAPSAYKDMFATYMDLFCIPGSHNAPGGAECGAAADEEGHSGAENFIDFFTSEKTWPEKTILDVMKLARVYFGFMPDKEDMGNMALDPERFVKKNARLARNALRLSIINYLAARRGPTSSATYNVLMSAIHAFLPSGAVAGVNYAAFCDKDTKTAAEEYVCSYTAKPADGQKGRIISQAAIDRIMQYDFYLSPNFHNQLNSKFYKSKVPIQRLKVYMKAQQLTQDYRALRMLQMKVAVEAMNMMNEDLDERK